MKYLTPANIYNRLKSESPTFFNKMRKVMVAVGTLGSGLIGAQVMYPGPMDFISPHVGGYMITVGVVGTFLTSLTVKDPNSDPKIN